MIIWLNNSAVGKITKLYSESIRHASLALFIQLI